MGAVWSELKARSAFAPLAAGKVRTTPSLGIKGQADPSALVSEPQGKGAFPNNGRINATAYLACHLGVLAASVSGHRKVKRSSSLAGEKGGALEVSEASVRGRSARVTGQARCG